MITDRYKIMIMFPTIIFVIINITLVKCINESNFTTEYHTILPEGSTTLIPEARIQDFSPKVDYNEWTPVGRGDPLKNDPTYSYSPPVLDRVRYWADNNNNNNGQNENNGLIHAPVTANAEDTKDKSEILLLGVPAKRSSYRKESKYPSNGIRRNYYYHHRSLPTRLMPPPMQTISPTLGSTGLGSNKLTTETVHHIYHHVSSPNSYTSSPGWVYNKPYHYDARPDESINYLSITKPETGLPSAPTAISSLKLSNEVGPFKRKPWLHELLQKEITKVPLPSSAAAASMNYVATTQSQVNLMHDSFSMSTERFVPPNPTMPTIRFTPTIITTTTSTTTAKPPSPAYSHSTPPITTSTTTTTIAPKQNEMATNSPFKHHKQQSNPLFGPMYLIIEGHSKVKTYGLKDNGTDLHKARIRPIPAKQDPIVKHVEMQDDFGKNMEIKHLHKKPNSAKANLIESETKTESSLNLLSFLDSSLGSFFGTNQLKVLNGTTIIPKENISEAVFVTTDSPVILTTKSTETEPTKIFVTTTEEIKTSRQIFDYDQMTESNFFDFLDDYMSELDGQKHNLQSTDKIETKADYQ